MGSVTGQGNPLALGFYSVREAAHLIEVGSTRRIYGWLRGYADRAAEPLIRRQFEPIDGIEEISFLDLMELRLIEMLREQKVRPHTIRKSIVKARDVFKSDKPFATDRIVLRTDGASVFVEEVLKVTAKSEDDRRLWNLVTNQYVNYELIEKSLITGVQFDPESHYAKTWVPRPIEFPRILIDPRIAYGKPFTPGFVPTDAVYDAWKAENENIAAVADWFVMPVDEVEMAVRFQQRIMEPPSRAEAA